MSRPVIFYGAGETAAKILGEKSVAEPTPPLLERGVCFADDDTSKHGTLYLGLPVVSIETALAGQNDAIVYITVGDSVNHSVYRRLIAMGVSSNRIENGTRLSCPYLENFVVCGYHEGAFGGKAGYDSGGHSFKSCCSDYGKNNAALVPIKDSLSEAFDAFIKLRDDTLYRLNTGEPTMCDGCIELALFRGHESSKFFYVIFNELGVCNCKCSYCNYQERLEREPSADVDFVQLMRLVNKYGFDKEKGLVELCNGEITIHPQKKAIYEEIEDYNIMFLTNGLVYDEFIRRKLADGTGTLNLSIDCGTQETFKKIKGLDVFDRVVGNLRRYAYKKKGVLNLKYIFLPGVNDNRGDVDGFVDLCAELDVTSAHISHNLCLPYEDYDNEHIIFSVKYMLDRLKAQFIPFELYSKDIISRIIGIA
jgi:pyruvate-formate lyase-activating enzyme